MSPTRRSFLRSAEASVAALPAVPAIAGVTREAEGSRLILPPRFMLTLRASVVERANNGVVGKYDHVVMMASSGAYWWYVLTYPDGTPENLESINPADMSAYVFLDHLAYAVTGRERPEGQN